MSKQKLYSDSGIRLAARGTTGTARPKPGSLLRVGPRGRRICDRATAANSLPVRDVSQEETLGIYATDLRGFCTTLKI